MKHPRSHSTSSISFRLGAILSALIIMASASLAQQAPGPVGPPPGATPKEQTQDRQNREFRLRTVERDVAKTQVNQQRLKAAIDLVKQDFKRIQIVRNEMVDDLVTQKPLDYKLIAERAGEINKRAHRLKTFLMQPVSEEQEKETKPAIEYKHEEIKGALVKLCNTIYKFTENPILKTPDVVDVEQSTKAGGDLLSIIELSDNIKRSVEKLGRQ
ncbi:MAG TPA: hypothetical protein VEQ40_11605 [Pyrinomonadaceae bacterium]|nr:hypothetical protein [Pyrinomonadaceae bacterium]